MKKGIQITNPHKCFIIVPSECDYKEIIKPIKWLKLITLFILEILIYLLTPVVIIYSMKFIPILVTFTPPTLLGIFLAMLIILIWVFVNLTFKELKYKYCNFE